MAGLRTPSILVLFGPFALLTACANQGPFPSLAPRAVERLSNDEPARASPIVAADPQLGARVAELLAQVRQGQSQFQAALPGARASVGRAGAAGTESWIEAQQAVSRLEAARAASATALAQLDRLSVERAAGPTNGGDFATLLSALEEAGSLVRAQQVEIARLTNALRQI